MGRQSHLQPRSLASLRLRARRIEGGDAHPSPPPFPLARRSLSLCDQFCDVPDSNQPPPFVPSLTSACNYAPTTVSSRYFLFLFHYFRFQASPSVTSPTAACFKPHGLLVLLLLLLPFRYLLCPTPPSDTCLTTAC